MKSFMVFVLAAAGVEATFKNASPFKCPANTDNKCTPKQSSGFDWSDLNLGGFANYNDFNFNGWTCGSSGGGGRFSGSPGGKFISGTCHSDKSKSPSFGCGPAVDKFSLGAIKVEPEFDCDLEFHYEMPDGSACKHRNACKKSGTLVKNTQCGGAKKVTIVYPPQPNKPKQSCSVKVPTVSFDCSTASSTKPLTSTKQASTSTSKPVITTSEVKTTSTSAAATTSSVPAETTSSVSPGETTSATVPGVETTATVPGESTITTAPGKSTTVTLPGEETTSVSPGESTVPAEETTTAPAPGEETSTATIPGAETTATVPAETTTAPAETTTAPAETTTAPAETVTLSTPITTVITTEFQTTSTIFSTVIQTITQCEPTVPDCPANGGVTTTVATVVVSTTICPVTETLTTVISTSIIPAEPTSTPVGGETTVVSPGETTVVAPGETTVVAPGESTVVVPGVTTAPGEVTTTAGVPTTIVTSVKPVETLPCPNVVPSCLNTFLFSVGCQDNTDTECYCPDAIFVKNVYDCLYAHGESDQVVSEAVIFFQGLCAPWVDKNPAVVTAPTVTSYITVTAAPTVAPVYTTITIDTTTVEPCTDDAGEIIPGSSTTVVVATTVPVPQVGFTTGSAGVVDVIPITAAPVFNGGEGSNGGGAVITANGTAITVPTGTGSIRPTQSVVLAGSTRIGTSFGLAAGIALIAAFGL
ncbi:hypothetical protein QBC38DRAFT_509658 [Podospora fimiseda]|uniref:CFEM domain-containing protein n=1 Tax=Podospora fimiseda TaxID=252190 RepID=A0AAN7BPU7_9PEZI|nr:hypothetical protein QBC38DRAFT_509658 [Podospora fimiseda]